MRFYLFANTEKPNAIHFTEKSIRCIGI
jgi:hypothetical protein